MAKKTVMKISPEGMRKIADHLGYKGDMANLKDFLASDPAKQHLVNRYYDKAKKLYKAAKGGMLYAQRGGATANDQRPPPPPNIPGQQGDSEFAGSNLPPQAPPFKPGEQGVPGIDNLPPKEDRDNRADGKYRDKPPPKPKPTPKPTPPAEVSPIEKDMQDMAKDPQLKGDQRVDAEKIDYDKASQEIREGTGQLKGSDPQARTKKATQAPAITAPQRKAGATYDATKSKDEVDKELDKTEAEELDKKSIDTIDAAQEDESSVADLEAEQGEGIKMDDLKTSGRERKLSEEEKVEAVADAREAAEFAEEIEAAQGEPSEKATMRGQMAEYMKDFEDGNVPKWAAGAMRAVVNQMAAQGISGSNATQAAMQAMLEKSIDLASIDAATFSKFESQNLSNRQQRAVLAAEQRAKFMGQEFDQKFQAKVINAAKVSDVANINFTAEQQIALENSRIANTMNLQNLSNRQALVMAEAAAVANLDMANLNNRQQANVQNAQNFLAVDMANLNNRQQTSMFKSQAAINSIMSDTAAQNAAKQFNAQSENQMNQFYDNLSTQVQQFNASQSNAMSQFNAGQENAMSQFNTNIQNQRDQFNAQNQMIIAQSNTQWRRQIATADTAAQNRANELNAQALIGMSTMAYQQIWQQYGDAMERAWRSSESKLDRLTSLAQTKMEIEGKANLASAQRRSNNFGLIGGFLMDFLGF